MDILYLTISFMRGIIESELKMWRIYMFSVYIVQNIISQKVYVGQSISPVVRCYKHFSMLKNGKHQNSHLQSSYNSDGKDCFVWFVLGEYNMQEEVDEAETFYISWYRDLGLSYNFTVGGGHPRHSEETKQKIGNAHRGRVHTEEARKNMSKSRRRNPLSQEHKDKIRNSLMGKSKGPMSREQKDKISNTLIGREGTPHTEKSKRKLSESNRGRKPAPQTIEAVREAQRGNKNRLGKLHTEETKQKIREARAKQVLDETYRKNLSESLIGHTGYWAGKTIPKDVLEKRRAGIRKYYASLREPVKE